MTADRVPHKSSLGQPVFKRSMESRLKGPQSHGRRVPVDRVMTLDLSLPDETGRKSRKIIAIDRQLLTGVPIYWQFILFLIAQSPEGSRCLRL